ncbi:MAG: urea ABC transporter permease subunit UrtB, partial [Pseudomonadota bacterium]|nr:urea ABC transporter permease subunit UrtB [Pseudomonadota bacterium]
MRMLLRGCCAALLLLVVGAAQALSSQQTLAIAAGDNDARIAALTVAAAGGDPGLAAFVQSLLDDEVKVAGEKVYVVHDGKTSDAASGAAASLPDAADDVSNNNRMRGALEAVLAVLQLSSPDLAVRSAAVADLSKASLDEAQLPLVEKALAGETDPGLKDRLTRMRATLLVTSANRDRRLAAAKELGTSSQSSVANLLQ